MYYYTIGWGGWEEHSDYTLIHKRQFSKEELKALVLHVWHENDEVRDMVAETAIDRIREDLISMHGFIAPPETEEICFFNQFDHLDNTGALVPFNPSH